MTKLHRFMGLVKCRMEDCLRDLVFCSTASYCDLLCIPCEGMLGLQEDFVWGRDMINSLFLPRTDHVFTMELLMNENGAYYSNDLNDFEPIIVKHFDEAIRRTHNVSQIDPLLLSSLLYDGELRYSSVGLLDPAIVERRNHLRLCYRKALLPLRAYAAQYQEHVQLFTMNVAAFIAGIRDANKSAQEIKEEISFQIRMRENLERTLPANITIGPFFIVVEPLKKFLINKRIELTKKMLDMFAQRWAKLNT
jgi:dynein heavy chain